MDNDKKIEYLKFAYEDIRNIISLADSKANISISLQSLFLTIGLGSFLLTDNISKICKSGIDIEIFTLSLIGLYIVITAYGIYHTFYVYKPRSAIKKQRPKYVKGILYFKDITEYNNYEEYYEKIDKLGEGELLKEFSHEIYQIANIANEKMKYVNKSIDYIKLNLILTVILLALNIYMMIFCVI